MDWEFLNHFYPFFHFALKKSMLFEVMHISDDMLELILTNVGNITVLLLNGSEVSLELRLKRFKLNRHCFKQLKLKPGSEHSIF